MWNTLVLAWASFAATPELVVINARMPTAPGKSALIVSGGRIAAVTTDAPALAAKGAATRVVDARGRLLLPGLIDSHIHFLSGGFAEDRIQLGGARDKSELLARIKAYAEAHKEPSVLRGRGWSYDLFQGALPTRQLLDGVVSDRPVVLSAYDGHSAWVNSAALALAGIDKTTPDPKNGKILRAPDGTPSGTLLEDAMDLVYAKLPEETPAEKQRALLAAQGHALAAGLTAINDFAAGMETYEAYAALERAGKLTLKVFFSPPLETPLEEVSKLKARIGKESKRVRFGSLKGFVDGVVESNTAAFLAPYADDPKHRASPHLSAAELDALIQPADKAGLPVSLHAIGDAAVRASLDAYERAGQKNGTRDRRHRIEHIEVLHADDAKRFAALGVVASMQPFHAEPSDQPGNGVWEKKVGSKRLPLIFPWKTIRDAGGTLAFGSDWAVVTLDPLKGLAVALTRKNGHNLPAPGWSPAQALPLEAALDAYTRSAAFALHAEDQIGALREGLAADFVILGGKVAQDEPLSFYWGSVDATYVDGKQVSGRLP